MSDCVKTAPTCRVDDYLGVYEQTATGHNSPSSRHGAALALRRVIAAADPPPGSMSDLGRAFSAYKARAAQAIEAAADQTTAVSLKRSFNSTINSAASVFCSQAVYAVQTKLAVPDMKKIIELVKRLKLPDAKKTAEEYKRPSDEILCATLAGWPQLPRNEFVAVGLALCAGLRRGEIVQAQWEWFNRPDGAATWLEATGDFKDQTGFLRCRLLEPFYRLFLNDPRIRGEKWAGLMLTDSHNFDRNISAWMRGLGWQTRKHLHALRAWAGSLVYMRYGAATARAFCRHADESTTRQFYGWLRDDWRDQTQPVLVAGQPVEWAR